MNVLNCQATNEAPKDQFHTNFAYNVDIMVETFYKKTTSHILQLSNKSLSTIFSVLRIKPLQNVTQTFTNNKTHINLINVLKR